MHLVSGDILKIAITGFPGGLDVGVRKRRFPYFWPKQLSGHIPLIRMV